MATPTTSTFQTNSYPLNEALKYAPSFVMDGMVETLIQESPVLSICPFETVNAESYRIPIEDTLPDIEFRATGEQYVASHGKDTEREFHITAMGGEFTIDNITLKAFGAMSQKTRQFYKFSKSMSRRFDKAFFKGTSPKKKGDRPEFAGLNELIDGGLGQTVDIATNGGKLTAQKMDEAIDKMRHLKPTCWFMNRTVRRSLTDTVRNTGGQFPLVPIQIMSDHSGRALGLGQHLYHYNDAPIFVVGDDSDGADILGFNETQGTSSTATSVYAVYFERGEGVFGLAGAGGSLTMSDFGEVPHFQGHLGRMEWYPGLAIGSPYAVVRIKGVTAS